MPPVKRRRIYTTIADRRRPAPASERRASRVTSRTRGRRRGTGYSSQGAGHSTCQAEVESGCSRCLEYHLSEIKFSGMRLTNGLAQPTRQIVPLERQWHLTCEPSAALCIVQECKPPITTKEPGRLRPDWARAAAAAAG